MFDIGFLEIVVIGAISLMIVGPDRLPGTIKSCVMWIGRIKRMARKALAEVEEQIGADEIRRELHNEEVMESLKSLEVMKDEIKQKLLENEEQQDEDETDYENEFAHYHDEEDTDSTLHDDVEPSASHRTNIDLPSHPAPPKAPSTEATAKQSAPSQAVPSTESDASQHEGDSQVEERRDKAQ